MDDEQAPEEPYICDRCGLPMKKREERRPLAGSFGGDTVWTNYVYLVCPNGHEVHAS